MDILNSVMDFDLSSFILGITSAGAATFAVRKRSTKKTEKTTEGKQQKIDEMLTTYEPLYLTYSTAYDSIEHDLAEVKAKITLTFPDDDNAWQVLLHEEKRGSAFGIERKVEEMKKYLNRMLIQINALKNSPLDTIDVKTAVRELEACKGNLANDARNLPNLIGYIHRTIENRPKDIQDFLDGVEALTLRFEKAKASIADIEAKYDPLFRDKLPGALLRAERAYTKYMEIANEISTDKFRYPWGSSDVKSNANQMMKRLENHIAKVLNYTDTAHREAVKCRRNLNSEWYRLENHCHRFRVPIPEDLVKRKEKALLSLHTAETQEYNGGNPAKQFEETIKPYEGLLWAINENIRKK